METDNELIQKTVNLILEKHKDEIDGILLFGSHADRTNIWRSDIDIAVVFKKNINNLDAGKFRMEMMGKTDEKVDLQVFNVLPVKIKKSIADNHKILFASESFNDIKFITSNQSIFFEFQRRVTGVEV